MIEDQEIMKRLNSIEGMLNKQEPGIKEILTLTQACDYLGVSKSYIYKLTSSKCIPHYCPTGKRIYFKRSELDDWLLQNKQTSAADIEKEAANYLIKKNRPV